MDSPRIHDFDDSLALSHAYAEAPWWFEIYAEAFPTMRACVSVRKDGWAQRAGIDRILTLECGRQIKVDEKIRLEAWDDILLERWSNEQKRIPGWIQKPLDCDFIAYAFVPTSTCYLLPVLTLQRAWRLHGRKWCQEYQEIRAHNRNYETISVAVPIAVLFAALNDAMIVRWKASSYNADDDMRRSIEHAYAHIRKRKADGGKGWPE